MRLVNVALLALSALAFTSCSTILNENNRDLTVVTEPGATVSLNGRSFGSSGDKVYIGGTEIYNPVIMVEKEGFETRHVRVPTHFQNWTIGNFFLGLLPVVVDAATGNAMALSTHEIKVDLKKKA